MRLSSSSLCSGAAGAGLTFLLVLVLGWRQTAPQDLSVRSLTLVDESGRTRAALSAQADQAGLAFFGAAGKERLKLQTTVDEALATFSDPLARARIVLTSGRDDDGLYFHDANAGDALSLVTTSKDCGLYFPGDRGLYVETEAGSKRLRLVTED